jgi:hypothetical protein
MMKAVSTPLAVIVAVALTAALLGLNAKRAEACSCLTPEPNAMLANSEAAFLGTYVGLGDRIKDDDNVFGPQQGYNFTVDTWLSGPFDGAEIMVKSADNGAACGFEFQPGAAVAVFIREIDDKGRPVSGLCSSMDGDQARATLDPANFEPSDTPPLTEPPVTAPSDQAEPNPERQAPESPATTEADPSPEAPDATPVDTTDVDATPQSDPEAPQGDEEGDAEPEAEGESAAQDTDASAGSLPWLLIAIAAVVVGVLAILLWRRRSSQP